MSPKFQIGDVVTESTHGDQVVILRVWRETHGSEVKGFSYGVVAPALGITVPFKRYEKQLSK